MGKPRACDVCSLRKIRCNGIHPCDPCAKAGFECSFTKKPLKPGPKGPRAATCNRIKKQVQDIRSRGGLSSRHESASTSPIHSPPRSVPQAFESEWYRNTDERSVPPSNSAVSGPSSITFPDVCAYLEIYHHKLYPVWPVVDRLALAERLGVGMRDPETCALAFSVCAATGAQLRLHEDPLGGVSSQNVPGLALQPMTDRFAIEAERHRSMYDYREQVSVPGILIPFFLHSYYAKKKRGFTSTLLLRESVTMCQLLELDKEASYPLLDLDEQRYRRKVFWLLFVTERGHAMQNSVGVSLQNSVRLPRAEDDRDPLLLMAFLSLVQLFVAVDGTLVGTGPGSNGPVYTKEAFAQLQQQLRMSTYSLPPSNEVQKVDISITQQWMRMLVWQLAMKHVSMSTSSGDDPMSLTYPVNVADDALSFLSKVSLDSLVAHGPGMEIKIFEIANTLLDVINCVPSLSYNNSSLMRTGPQDTFHQLSCLLSNLSSGQSPIVSLLQSKITESKVPFTPIPRLLELNDSVGRSPLSIEVNSAPSNADWDYDAPTEEDEDTSILPNRVIVPQSSASTASSSWEAPYLLGSPAIDLQSGSQEGFVRAPTLQYAPTSLDLS